MKTKNNYTAYALMGIGLYFFITQYNHPLIHMLDTWPVFIIGLGVWFILRTIKHKNNPLFIQGWLLIMIGIHIYGLQHFDFWIDHWAMFPLMWGIAYIITYLFTKRLLIPSVALIGGSLLFMYSEKLPDWVPSFARTQQEILSHWPLILIVIGLLLYFYKRK